MQITYGIIAEKELLKYFLYLLPSIIYLTICTILLTLPGDAFPEENWFSKVALDKWIHIGMFGCMTMIIVWSIFKMQQNSISFNHVLLIGLSCLIFGIAMEFVQKYWVFNRSFDGADIIADGIGASLGVFVSNKIVRRYLKK